MLMLVCLPAAVKNLQRLFHKTLHFDLTKRPSSIEAFTPMRSTPAYFLCKWEYNLDYTRLENVFRKKIPGSIIVLWAIDKLKIHTS